MILDSHLHLVPPDRSRYPLRPVPADQRMAAHDPEAIATKWEHSVESLTQLLAASGVDRGVLVHTYPLYAWDCSATVDAAEQHPDRFRAVVQVDPHAPDQAAQLAALAAHPTVTGARLRILFDASLLAPEGQAAWDACRDAGLTIEALVTGFTGLAPLIRRVAPLPVVLHGGAPPELGRLAAGCPDAVTEELLDLPNCLVKLSSTVLRDLGEAADPADGVAAIVAAFGADRVVWGSDYPQAVGAQTYDGLVTLARRSVRHLDPAGQDALLAANAARLWGW